MSSLQRIEMRESRRHVIGISRTFDNSYGYEKDNTYFERYYTNSPSCNNVPQSPLSQGHYNNTISSVNHPYASTELYSSPKPNYSYNPSYSTNPFPFDISSGYDIQTEIGDKLIRQFSSPTLNGGYEMDPPIFLPSSDRTENLVSSRGYCTSTSPHPANEISFTQQDGKPESSFASSRGSGFNPETTKNKKLPPGEKNPHATLGAKLCYNFMNKGICERQLNHNVCHYRHLDANHPDAIADRFKNNLLSQEEIDLYRLRKCEKDEVNPFAAVNAKICYDYLNKKVCSRTAEMRICRFRHLLPSHPEAIADRKRTLKRK